MTLTCILPAFALASTYVVSLYIWGTGLERDHPVTVKRRITSGLSMLLLSPPYVYFFAHPDLLSSQSFLSILGLRTSGLFSAVTLPLVLTALLFLGPIAMGVAYGTKFRLLLMPEYWKLCLSDLIWWRNHVFAPLTEEFTYRTCLLPILLKCFTPKYAVFISPSYFGVAHLHHLIEKIRQGQELKLALLTSLFQMTYTTIFGMYSAFLFVRTGHTASPVLVHAFCNFMGFPNFAELAQLEPKSRNIMIGFYVTGVILFVQLLFPLTEPSLYDNEVYSWS